MTPSEELAAEDWCRCAECGGRMHLATARPYGPDWEIICEGCAERRVMEGRMVVLPLVPTIEGRAAA